MKILFLNFLIILSLIYINMSSGNNFSEIEYHQRIISNDKSFTFFSVKFIKKEKYKIEAKYQKGKCKLEIDPNTFSFVDKTGTEGLKIFEITNEELGLKNNDEIFKNLEEINFPEETDFRNALFPDFPIWHIVVDGKDYQGNVNTEFYNRFDNIVNIKKIEEYVIKKYNS